MPPPSGRRGPTRPGRRRGAAPLAALAAIVAIVSSAHAAPLDGDRPDPLADVLKRARAGVVVPPGAVEPSSLPARRPAEVLLRLGADPLGIAAALRVEPAGFWASAGAVVIATGPDVSARGRIHADGSARLSFTPPTPGGIRVRMYVSGKAIKRAKGIGAALVRPGDSATGALLEVVDVPEPAPDPGGEPTPEQPVPAPIPGPEPAPVP